MYVRMCLGMPIPYKCIQVCLQAHGWSYMHVVIHTVALIVCTIFDLTSICVCVCMIMFVWFCIYESWANANLSPLFAFSQGSFFFQNERFGWFGCDSVPWQVFRGSLATLSPKWKNMEIIGKTRFIYVLWMCPVDLDYVKTFLLAQRPISKATFMS